MPCKEEEDDSQLVRLRKWAEEQNCWFDDRSQFCDFFDRGSENEVYLSPDGTEIIILNDFRYSDENLASFFERIKAHNQYFDACPYRMIGFAENRDGKVSRVATIPTTSCRPTIRSHNSNRLGL